MNENVLFRKATSQDAAPIKEIAKRVILHNYVPFLGIEASSAFIDSGMSDQEIDDGLDHCTVIISDGIMLGFAITIDELLHLIMVDVPFQSKGYGGKLLKYIETELFSQYETIHLQTFKENADAAQFYLKNGWHIVGEEEIIELDKILLLFMKTFGG